MSYKGITYGGFTFSRQKRQARGGLAPGARSKAQEGWKAQTSCWSCFQVCCACCSEHGADWQTSTHGRGSDRLNHALPPAKCTPVTLALCRNKVPVGIIYLWPKWLHLQWSWGCQPGRGPWQQRVCIAIDMVPPAEPAWGSHLPWQPAMLGATQKSVLLVHCGLPTTSGLCWAQRRIFWGISLCRDGAHWCNLDVGGAWLLAGSWWYDLACSCDRRGWLHSRERRLYLRTESTKQTTHLWPPLRAASDTRAAPLAEWVSLPPCWWWRTLPCF